MVFVMFLVVELQLFMLIVCGLLVFIELWMWGFGCPVLGPYVWAGGITVRSDASHLGLLEVEEVEPSYVGRLESRLNRIEELLSVEAEQFKKVKNLKITGNKLASNKIGTRLLGLAAHDAELSFYVACENSAGAVYKKNK
jgi:hypothetical protein